MNEVREIVTKAVVEKGKKNIRIKERIKVDHNIDSVLGCWIINNSFEAEKTSENVEINGMFELNVWHSHTNNTKTDVVKVVVAYQEPIKTTRKVENYVESNNDVIVRMLQQPVCTDAQIVDGEIEVEIMFEVIAEVIGETKMQVSVLNQIEPVEDDDLEIDNEVEENFINDSIF